MVTACRKLRTYVRIWTLRFDDLLDILRMHDVDLHFVYHFDSLPLMALNIAEPS